MLCFVVGKWKMLFIFWRDRECNKFMNQFLTNLYLSVLGEELRKKKLFEFVGGVGI